MENTIYEHPSEALRIRIETMINMDSDRLIHQIQKELWYKLYFLTDWLIHESVVVGSQENREQQTGVVEMKVVRNLAPVRNININT